MATVYDTYFESSVLSADPVELVRILYRAALDSLETARGHLREGDIKARSAAITKASEILTELELSLNHEVGGSLSRNLLELYDYMQRRLVAANVEQSEPPLNEVTGLLTELLEAWNNVH